MKAYCQSGKNRREAGSALLIGIFALLLISVVGIALLVSTGTDTALAGNYRTSTAAYYASVAGLEEARGRLLWRNPDFINKSNAYPTLFSGQGTTFGLTDVLYILNPATGETVDPTNSTSPYADTEYAAEFGWSLSNAIVHTTLSVSPLLTPYLPGPLYKWVRINAVTEKAINMAVDCNSSLDPLTDLFYGGSGLYRPGSGCPSNPSTGVQALEITAFAYMPDKSTKLLQYVVAPNSLNIIFPAALTIAGNGVNYAGPNSTSFYVNGNDPTTGRTCTAPPLSPVSAIGYTNPADQLNVVAGTSSQPGNYVGSAPPPPAPATPSVGLVTLPVTLQKPSQLDALVQSVTQSADAVIPGPATGSNLTSLAMSSTNPMTVVINGDLDLTSWHNTGYGLLLVTGNLNYDPDASWEGIVLVIGRGTFSGSRLGSGRFDGAILIAQTRDPLGNLLPDPNLGFSSVNFNSAMGGVGIYYNSCMILQAEAPTSYRVLSFREITPP